jgi:hypothetical protein
VLLPPAISLRLLVSFMRLIIDEDAESAEC